MGPFHIPWPIAVVYLLSIIAVPAAIEILLHSKWWKRQSDFYYSFNEHEEENEEQAD